VASVLVVFGHTMVFVIAARVAGSTAPLGELLVLLMVIQVAGSIPLNIGGWGPREGAAAAAFAAAGLGAGTGVTVTTLYAVLMLIAFTPGGALLLRDAVRGQSRRQLASNRWPHARRFSHQLVRVSWSRQRGTRF